MVVADRPLRGSRLSSFYPPVSIEGPSLSDLDSAFQLQEYIALLIRQNPHDVDAIVTVPGKVKSKSPDATEEKGEQALEKEGKGEVTVDEACWIYEQLRRLAQDLTHPLITSLQLECTRASCPEMKAGEWLYLCVAHGNDGAMEQCCAIDYIIHTLDSATALLNSPRAFPSRISILPSSLRHFSSLARRLGRIFAHAYFHHREAFEAAEAESALYARFLALTARFDLVPAEFLVIPPRMLPDAGSDSRDGKRAEADPPRLLGAALNPANQQEPDSTSSSGEASTNRTYPPDAQINRPWSPEKRDASPVPSGHESPRKLGRNRTDTMVFSDAAAFRQAWESESEGSSNMHAESSARAQNVDVESTETKSETEANTAGGGTDIAGIPHIDKLMIVASSKDACGSCHAPSASSTEQEREPESAPEQELEPKKEVEKPYTLTFSASGTTKPSALAPILSSSPGSASEPLHSSSSQDNLSLSALISSESLLASASAFTSATAAESRRASAAVEDPDAQDASVTADETGGSPPDSETPLESESAAEADERPVAQEPLFEELVERKHLLDEVAHVQSTSMPEITISCAEGSERKESDEGGNENEGEFEEGSEGGSEGGFVMIGEEGNVCNLEKAAEDDGESVTLPVRVSEDLTDTMTEVDEVDEDKNDDGAGETAQAPDKALSELGESVPHVAVVETETELKLEKDPEAGADDPKLADPDASLDEIRDVEEALRD